MPEIFLITPPFTQLNTPYPATAYLKGFLNTIGVRSVQADLGIEVILKVFSRSGLQRVFAKAASGGEPSANALRILSLQSDYISTIDSVISFLQGRNPTLALRICQEDFLPEASRFDSVDDLDWAFGTMGTQDKAKHLATLYLEDLSDLIVECVDQNFGFSRYAERLGRSANGFGPLYDELNGKPTFFDEILFELLAERFESNDFKLLLISVPFPGNLYSAFRVAQWVKANHPEVKLAMGGGFANTELRSLSDVRVFEFFDFITLDDGERPVKNLIEYVGGTLELSQLKRTFLLINGEVTYVNGDDPDFRQSEVGTPDYSGLLIDEYISVIEIVNPMHRMWSDGRWNKLTMAHGCYWGKCTFCDISLDYIKIYEPIAAGILCDRMEQLIAQTGQTGFHFVDEAAPPALMRALAIEILRRGLTVTWWTNIRFEKSFSRDLCRLLKTSGCIAVSGGLEVASDRLLALIEKGVTVEQVARVTRNFTDAGIMVHSYLMYGFPTQTIQETVDSLEMVRQMFEAGILQSGFWHQFALTAHSPVGIDPGKYGVFLQSTVGTFANNDIDFTDATGIDHGAFSYGLKKSLYNFMHGIGFDFALSEWFDFRIPKTSVRRDFIANALDSDPDLMPKPSSKLVWTGATLAVRPFTKTKKNTTVAMAELIFHTKTESVSLSVAAPLASWIVSLLAQASVKGEKVMTFSQAEASFPKELGDFAVFLHTKPMAKLRSVGLLIV